MKEELRLTQQDCSSSERAADLFRDHQERIYARTDRLFAFLLLGQWLAGILISLTVSPLAWEGSSYRIHSHVFAAVVLGGLLIVWPLYLVKVYPAKAITRHVIAVTQALYSALLIHLTGGRIETHFHIFGSLALLAFYRDWRVLVSASAVVAGDHLLRGMLWPRSVFGVDYASPFRALEHAAWVIFEDIFLWRGISESVNEMKEIAAKRAEMESVNVTIEQKVAEKTKELAEREMVARRFASVLRQSEDAILLINKDGKIGAWNRGAERLYGYTAAEIEGQDWQILAKVENRSRAERIVNEVLLGRVVENLEGPVPRKDGSDVEVALTFSPIRDSEGNIEGASAVLRDITQKKLVETRIAEFYSTVSHELRTPLTSIRGALALLADSIVEPGSAEGMELIQLARTSTIKLVCLINDILDLRKIEAGQLELNVRDWRVGDLIENAKQTMLGLAEASEVTIRTALSRDGEITVDFDRINQVLTNLISNAIKYSPAGGTVEVGAEWQDGKVRFFVMDEGPGIPEQLQYKLFGKFQQIDSSDTRAKGGTGLGLAISKAIVEQHGGQIGFVSKPGIQTKFWFEFHGTPEVEAGAESASDGSSAKVNDASLNVMVIEDDRELSAVVKIFLEHKGYHCAQANKLADARTLLAKNVPDAIVLDIGLPDGTGLDLIDELRSSGNPLLKEVPVVVITGGEADATELYKATICDWLLKPFDQEVLSRSIDRAIKRRPPQKLLVVEDEERTREILAGHLTAAGTEFIASDFKGLSEQVRPDWKPDLILLGANARSAAAFEALEVLRQVWLGAVPIIFYSTSNLPDSERQDIFCGINRYLTRAETEAEFLKSIEALLVEMLPNRCVEHQADRQEACPTTL